MSEGLRNFASSFSQGPREEGMVKITEDRFLFYIIIISIIAFTFGVWYFFLKDSEPEENFLTNDQKKKFKESRIDYLKNSQFPEPSKEDLDQSFIEESQEKYESQGGNINLTPNVYPELEEKIEAEPDEKRDSKGEIICRRALENIYGVKFPKIRPDWLKNPVTKRNLELDCYNDELKIALEYNGYQHYVFPNCFHKTEEEFYSQVKRDHYKKAVCDLHGIHLIEVPYTVKHDKIYEFIVDNLPNTE